MPFPSQFPPVNLVDSGLHNFLFNRKERPFPDNKILYEDSDTNTTYTFSDVYNLSVRFGEALRSKLSFTPGNVLALVAPNDIDTAAVVFGTSYAGGVVSPANPTYTVSELVFQLRDSQARIIATHSSTLSTVLAAANEVGIPASSILTLGADQTAVGGTRHWTSILSPQDPFPDPYAISTPKTAPAFLCYSSGTTGRPKAVVLSHHNLTSNILQLTATEKLLTWNGGAENTIPGIPPAPHATYDQPNTGGDKLLAVLPFFHIYGLMVHIFLPLWQGTHSVVLPRFELLRFCQLVQQHKITFAYIVPPMALGLSKHPKVAGYDLSSLRMTNSSAAPLTKELVEALWKRCGVRVKQAYGLSETSPGITVQSWGEWWSARGAVGRLIPNMEARFCETAEGAGGDAGVEIASGEVGELWIRGPNVFRGYLGNEKATRECLSEDGWFRTGDVGFVDPGGNVWITDRAKELIKYKGFQVAPAELEGVLLECDIIDDVAVVGVWDEENGTEVPRAWVVRKGGMGAVRKGDEEVVAKWLTGKVAQYKQLRGGVRWAEQVPKSASGKILRRVLKEQVREEEAQKMKEGEDRARL